MTTRNRRTQAQMLEHFEAEAQRMRDAIAGKPDTTTENGILKSLKARLRKTNTEMRSASAIVNGILSKDGTTVLRGPIMDKITATEARLRSQIETRNNAEEFLAKVAFSIETLETTIASAEQGDEVTFPTDLVPLPSDQDRTPDEHEVAFITKDNEEGEGS